MKKVVCIVIMLVVVLEQIGIAYGADNPPAIYSGTGVVIDSSQVRSSIKKTKMNKLILLA